MGNCGQKSVGRCDKKLFSILREIERERVLLVLEEKN
jgi:hypothetical protein